MPNIVSLDLETTGLNVEQHEVWELGLVPLDSGRESMHLQFQPTDLEVADPESLQICGFYTRFDWITDPRLARDMLVDAVLVDEDPDTGAKTERPDLEHKALTHAGSALWRVAKALEGATLMGLNVGSFDAPFLAKLLRKYGHSPTWSHRYLELGSYAAGAWGAAGPLSGRAIADRLEAHGVENRELHNAYSDALWNVDAYNFVRETVL